MHELWRDWRWAELSQPPRVTDYTSERRVDSDLMPGRAL
jgi:hypothetical protein